MSDSTDKPQIADTDWRKSPKTGLWVPKGTPDGGKKPTTGFARIFDNDPPAPKR